MKNKNWSLKIEIEKIFEEDGDTMEIEIFFNKRKLNKKYNLKWKLVQFWKIKKPKKKVKTKKLFLKRNKFEIINIKNSFQICLKRLLLSINSPYIDIYYKLIFTIQSKCLLFKENKSIEFDVEIRY